MIFGEHVQAPDSTAAAAWIEPACRGAWGTVGALVPNDYATYVRVWSPDTDADDWWDAYRDLFDILTTVGARHTSTPDRAWFAIWEGYGWATSTLLWAYNEGALDVERQRAEDARRREPIRAGLAELPRFGLPNRDYYLVCGNVAAATQISQPGPFHRWQRPELFWPDDRRWFVATDVDFWSLYIGGDHDFVDELTAAIPTPSEPVTLDQPLENED